MDDSGCGATVDDELLLGGIVLLIIKMMRTGFEPAPFRNSA